MPDDHAHEHTHTHSHGHDHDHEHSHEHEHSHSHEHTHEGDHAHSHGGGDVDKLKGLLKYMVDHNRDHAAELDDLAHKLYHTGRQESADLIQEAVRDFGKVNDQLAKALDLVGDGK
jgi:molecular chaperone GrpE (heat shock protein)